MGNPWLSIWSTPRQTIDSIARIDPNYGLWVLSFIYALTNAFYLAHIYSWGLEEHVTALSLLWLLLSPLFGWLVLSFDALFFTWIGRLLKGKGEYGQVRCAVVWAKIPYCIALFMWVCFAIFIPEEAFIQYVDGVSFAFIAFITASSFIWSTVLLIQGLALVHAVSWMRSISIAILSWVPLFFLYLIAVITIRYVIINII